MYNMCITKHNFYYFLRAVIAVNQDPLGIQGRRLLVKENIEVGTLLIYIFNP